MHNELIQRVPSALEKPERLKTGHRAGVRMGQCALLAAFLALASWINTTTAATLVVTATDDGGPGSLRPALAVATNGDTVDVTGLSGVITLTGAELLITNSLSIKGPGPDRLAINGNFPAATNRVFHVTNVHPCLPPFPRLGFLRFLL
jgi:hypothetical protein